MLDSNKLEKSNEQEENKIICMTGITQSLNDAIKTKRFWRCFILYVLFALPYSVFFQCVTSLPIYLEREIGGDSIYGWILALRSLMMIIFTVIFTIFVYHASTYNILILASVIMGASPLVFVISNDLWAVFVFVIIVSLGTAIFEPRLFDYLVLVSPPNQEALYMGTASMSYSISILTSGLMGGILLNEYVPEDGERQAYMLWIFVSIVSLFATLMMIIFRKWLEQPLSQQETQPFIFYSQNQN